MGGATGLGLGSAGLGALWGFGSMMGEDIPQYDVSGLSNEVSRYRNLIDETKNRVFSPTTDIATGKIFKQIDLNANKTGVDLNRMLALRGLSGVSGLEGALKENIGSNVGMQKAETATGMAGLFENTKQNELSRYYQLMNQYQGMLEQAKQTQGMQEAADQANKFGFLGQLLGAGLSVGVPGLFGAYKKG